ncbi:hypothetical protein FRC06_002522, partial [Ceratobasidium sp. 370]
MSVSQQSSRSKSTPVLVIRAPVQPPLSQDDWEPPSALGVQSPEGFKSEISISQLRPFTPSPSVSTFAPSSATSSSATTPTAPPPTRPEVPHILHKATEALALHAQQSLDSVSSESVYSDPGVAPESLFDDEPPKAVESVEPTERVEPQVEPEEPIEPVEIPEHDNQSIVTDPAFESLQVARPLSPVAVELASSSSAGTSHSQPIIRSSLLGFFSRWADKRSPSLKESKSRPISSAEPSDSQPPPSAPATTQQHDSTSGPPLSTIVSRDKSTERLGEDPVKPSSASFKSSVFRKSSFGGLRLGKSSRADRGPTPPLPPLPPLPSPGTPDIHVTPPPETRTVLVADIDLPPEAHSVRSGKRRRRFLESQSSAGTSRSKAAQEASSEEPIGGEPVLISAHSQSQLQPQSDEPELDDTLVPLPVPEARNLPTPPRSRSPSIFRQKLGGRYRKGSLGDFLRKSSPNKQRKEDRPNSPAFFSWLTSHTQRSQQTNKQTLPTPSATPDPLHSIAPPVPASIPGPSSPERVLSLVWYPPELIKSPYASNTSLDRIRAPHPTPAPLEEYERNASPPPLSVRTTKSAPQPKSPNPFYALDPYPSGGDSHIKSASSSTIHAPSTSSGRRTPAKLRRRRRPSKKADKNTPRTPPTAYAPVLSRNHSRASASKESVTGSAAPSTTPSRSLDTLLNSAWPEPPSVVASPTVEETNPIYYHSETGAEDSSDQEEYLPSPTSIGGSAPTSPVEPLPLAPIPLGGAADKDWEPGSRVTSYLSASPTIRSPVTPRVIRQNTPSSSTVRPGPVQASPPSVAPVLRAPIVPRRTTSYQSASSQPGSTPTLVARRRLSNLSRRDPYPASVTRPDSNHSQPERHSSSTGPELWTAPRNQRQRPTISFEFPPTSQFWEFLNEYQAFTQQHKRDISQDSGYAEPTPEEMEARSGSRSASAASKSTSRSVSAASASTSRVPPAVDPVKDWHKTSISSQGSVEKPATPFVPTPEVIQRNELIVNALKNAPGALQTRFRHFGQLGVLGWSSEFSELVDEIQRCGLERQMFTTTREQALTTCRDLLRLHIEVSMQMISIHFTPYYVPAGATSIDDSHHSITYSPPGAWNPTKDASAVGGSSHVSHVPGANVTIKFTGTGIEWFGKMSRNHKVSEVLLDGMSAGSANLWSNKPYSKQRLFGISHLENKEHTLTIINDKSGKDSLIDVDA